MTLGRVSHLRNPFIEKLKLNAPIGAEYELALLDLMQPLRSFHAHRDLVKQGDPPKVVMVIMVGWACRYKMLENGKRQIVALLLPGDLAEPFGALPDHEDHAIAAITPVVIAPIDVLALRRLASANERLEQALWWDLLMSQATTFERIMSLGRRSASERLGHLFCELYYRLDRVGMVADHSFEMPMVQADLADLLGLSTVHVNRSLQELRASGLISLSGRKLGILDLHQLQDASYFEPSSLHLDRRQPQQNYGISS